MSACKEHAPCMEGQIKGCVQHQCFSSTWLGYLEDGDEQETHRAPDYLSMPACHQPGLYTHTAYECACQVPPAERAHVARAAEETRL
eukprot:scaffold133167_cov14-Tisochrysis_lutea.AAC.1